MVEAAEEFLPPPEKPGRPLPWRALSIFFLPAAAFAAGVGLQRFFEGPQPAGDALLRWMLWSSGAGLALGALAGLLFRKRLLWPFYGAAAPWAAVFLVAAATRIARPVREALADRREQACRDSGRSVCTVPEFAARCTQAGAGLGPPRQKLCDAQGCTSRWVYTGPFRPETYVAPGALLCSAVSDAAGKGVRHALMPGDEPP